MILRAETVDEDIPIGRPVMFHFFFAEKEPWLAKITQFYNAPKLA